MSQDSPTPSLSSSTINNIKNKTVFTFTSVLSAICRQQETDHGFSQSVTDDDDVGFNVLIVGAIVKLHLKHLTILNSRHTCEALKDF